MERENKEKINFEKYPINGNHILQYILTGVVIVLLAAIVILCIYVKNVTIYFSPENEIYYVNIDGIDTYIWFSDEEMLQYSFSYMDDEKEVVYGFGKATYEYTGYYWKKFVGQLYFSENRFLSLKNVENGAKPATIIASCKDFKAFDYWYAEIDMSSSGLVGQSAKFSVYFYEDGMLMDGAMFQKINDFPDEVKQYIEFLDMATQGKINS